MSRIVIVILIYHCHKHVELIHFRTPINIKDTTLRIVEYFISYKLMVNSF
jgi:hypothetical protein